MYSSDRCALPSGHFSDPGGLICWPEGHDTRPEGAYQQPTDGASRGPVFDPAFYPPIHRHFFCTDTYGNICKNHQILNAFIINHICKNRNTRRVAVCFAASDSVVFFCDNALDRQGACVHIIASEDKSEVIISLGENLRCASIGNITHLRSFQQILIIYAVHSCLRRWPWIEGLTSLCSQTGPEIRQKCPWNELLKFCGRHQ